MKDLAQSYPASLDAISDPGACFCPSIYLLQPKWPVLDNLAERFLSQEKTDGVTMNHNHIEVLGSLGCESLADATETRELGLSRWED